MYPFQFGGYENDNPPTRDELIEGVLHHLSTALMLHGAGKNFAKWVDTLKPDTITIEDVREIMRHNVTHIDRLRTILLNLPTITVKKGDPDNEDDE